MKMEMITPEKLNEVITKTIPYWSTPGPVYPSLMVYRIGDGITVRYSYSLCADHAFRVPVSFGTEKILEIIELNM